LDTFGAFFLFQSSFLAFLIFLGFCGFGGFGGFRGFWFVGSMLQLLCRQPVKHQLERMKGEQ